MRIFKLSLILLTLSIFGVGFVLAQTKTSTQLNHLVKNGIQEQKTNPETVITDKEVTKGEMQSAGEIKRSGFKDSKEVQVPEVNVEKEIEKESKSSSSKDIKSQDKTTKSSSDKAHGKK
ncbi:hypothetical protein M1145_00995 [Patescibacteria group bacterium]|nr:hypothetical protein [Patescibacteria group bacterium]